jgi:hypothetical protein
MQNTSPVRPSRATLSSPPLRIPDWDSETSIDALVTPRHPTTTTLKHCGGPLVRLDASSAPSRSLVSWRMRWHPMKRRNCGNRPRLNTSAPRDLTPSIGSRRNNFRRWAAAEYIVSPRCWRLICVPNLVYAAVAIRLLLKYFPEMRLQRRRVFANTRSVAINRGNIGAISFVGSITLCPVSLVSTSPTASNERQRKATRSLHRRR